MVKKLKILLKSNWIRRCSVLMICALILLASVSPAFATVIDNNDYGKLETFMHGTLSFVCRPMNDDNIDSVTVQYPVGGRLPMPATTGNYYWTDSDESFLMNSTLDPEWNILCNSRFARYKYITPLDNLTFADVRFQHELHEQGDASGSLVWDSATLSLEDFYVPSVDSGIPFPYDAVDHLVTLRMPVDADVNVKFKLSFYAKSTNSFVTFASDKTYKDVAVNSEFYPFLDFYNSYILAELIQNTPFFISDISITVTPKSGQRVNYFNFELLGEYWYGSNGPIYIDDNPIGNFVREMDRLIVRVPQGDEASSQFVEFLAGAVGSFFNFEIYPGFTFAGIFSVLLIVVIIILILKFFAGG